MLEAKAQSPMLQLKIDQVMTPDEFRNSGVSALGDAQRRVLDQWLNRYTVQVWTAAIKQQSTTPEISVGRSSCSPAIESTISGELEAWSGDTIFKLDNGQIWQQAEYDYTYFYEYRPDVTIYQTNAGCRMKVEDEDDTVLVRRIK
jgi:hypothetical protein